MTFPVTATMGNQGMTREPRHTGPGTPPPYDWEDHMPLCSQPRCGSQTALGHRPSVQLLAQVTLDELLNSLLLSLSTGDISFEDGIRCLGSAVQRFMGVRAIAVFITRLITHFSSL